MTTAIAGYPSRRQSMTTTVAPQQVVSQDDSRDAATERCAVKLTLVLDGPTGIRTYPTNADAAWAYFNCPYDHAAGCCETPADADAAYYTE